MEMFNTTFKSLKTEDTFTEVTSTEKYNSTNDVETFYTYNVTELQNATAQAMEYNNATWKLSVTQTIRNYTEHLNDSLIHSASNQDVNFAETSFPTTTVFLPSFVYKAHIRPDDNGDFSTPDVSSEALILKTISLVLIALSGIFANGFITYSIVKDRNLHKPPFYYLLSFCVSDLSRAIFCVPLVMTSVLQGSVWKYGGAACKLFAFANSFFVYSSCTVLLAIAIDRHLSLVHVKFYKKRSRGLVNLISVIIGWTVAFTMSFPPVLGVGSYVFIPAESQCTFHHRFYKKNDTLAFMIVFTMIMFWTLFLYCRIFSFLRDHRRMRPLELQPARSSNWNFFGPGANGQAMINWVNGFGGPHPNPITNTNNGNITRNAQRPNIGRVVNLQIIKNEHLTRLFFIVTVVFCVLWAPYTILGFWRVFGDSTSIPSFLVTVSAWMTYAQIALCPLIYVVSRGPIRKSSRTIYNNSDKKEFLLENRNRK